MIHFFSLTSVSESRDEADNGEVRIKAKCMSWNRTVKEPKTKTNRASIFLFHIFRPYEP